MQKDPKISFMMIVFNGLTNLPEGMLHACLTNIYPFAHEILISEGAVQATNENKGDATLLSPDGRSTDGTLEFLQSFPDPQNKIKIYTKDGYWNGKLEMVNKAVSEATGTHIWEIDSDEFYHPEDMQRIIGIFRGNPGIQAVHFYTNQFFGSWDYCIDETHRNWVNQIAWRRIFKHSPGSFWVNHTPPIYSDKDGNLMEYNILDRETTLMMGIKLYHYSLVTKEQVEFKSKYYRAGGVNYLQMWEEWQKNHDIMLVNGDKTVKFRGEHPKVIQDLINEL